MADGDNVARPAHIQVRSREGDEAWVSHSMLIPTQHITQTEGYYYYDLIFSWLKNISFKMFLQVLSIH